MVCTVNIGTMIGRSREVEEMLARRRVDTYCVQEVQYREGCEMFGCGSKRHRLWWSGDKNKAGVGILVKEDLVEDIKVE